MMTQSQLLSQLILWVCDKGVKATEGVTAYYHYKPCWWFTTTQWEGTLYRASSLTTRLHLRFLSNQASGRSLSLPRPEFSCASVPLLGTPHHHTDCCRGRSGLAGPLDLRTLSLNGHSMIFLVYCPYHFCLQCNYEGKFLARAESRVWGHSTRLNWTTGEPCVLCPPTHLDPPTPPHRTHGNT